VFFISARQRVLQQKALVAKDVFDRRVVVNQVCRRGGDDDLDIAARNHFQPFASPEVQQVAVWRELTQDIEAKFLLEARRDRHQRSDPAGLLGLRLRYTRLPVFDGLRVEKRGGKQNDPGEAE